MGDISKDINLEEYLIWLKNERFRIECADDFAYTNGKIAAIDETIRSVEQEIKKKLKYVVSNA